MSSAEERLGAACPSGGDFYVCEAHKSRFVGCCESDPCKTDDGLCPDKDLGAMTFDTDAYNKIAAQDCTPQTSEKPLWYVCTGSSPPFMGCCTENPCGGDGCPAKSLRGARLSDDGKKAASFTAKDEKDDKDDKSTSSKTSSVASTSTSPSATGGAPSSTSAIASSSDGGLSSGATIGIAVGASMAGIIILAAVGFFFWRRYKKSRSSQADGAHAPFMGSHSPDNFSAMKHQSGYSSTTTGYHNGFGSPQMSQYTQPNSPAPYSDWQGNTSPHQGGMSVSPPPQGWNGSPQPGYHQGLAMAVSPPTDAHHFQQQQQPHQGAFVAELPGSLSQQSSDPSELPANPNTMSASSYSGIPGRESEVSGLSTSRK